ncbi:MAG: DUF4129 domain-containing protein [Spirochaeta sp.]
MSTEQNQPVLSPMDMFRKVMHPLMAIIPGMLVPLLLFTVGMDAAGMDIPWLAILAVQGVCGAAAIVGEYLFRAERAAVSARIREFVLLFGGLYVLVSLTRPGEMASRFHISMAHAVMIGPGFITWWMTTEIIARLEARLQVLHLTEGRYGDDLHQILRNNNEFVGQTISAIKGLLAMLSFGVAFVSLYVVIVVISAGRLGMPVLILYPPVAAVYFMMRSYVFLFWEELILASEGLQLPYRNLQRQGRLGLVLLVIAAVLAVGVAGNTALLPVDILLAPIHWLASFLDAAPEGRNQAITQFSERFQPEMMPQLEYFDDNYEPGWFAAEFLPLLRRLVMYAIIAGAVGFLTAPFFSRSFRRLVRKYGLLRSLVAGVLFVVQSVWQRISALFRREGTGRGYETVTREWSRRTGTVPGAEQLSRRKRRELDVLSRGYERITDWATARGVRFQPSEAPQYFAGRVSLRFPQVSDELTRFIEIFEEGMFSSRELSGTVLQEFQLLQRLIRRTRTGSMASDQSS